MKQSERYKDAISLLNNPIDLIMLWTDIVEGEVDSFWPEGKAMEYLILRAFELEGANVIWPFEIRENDKTIEQIDGVIYYNDLCCIFECKDSDSPINYEPVAKIRGQLLRRPAATIASIFSRSGYTESSLILAKYNAPHTILLWEKSEIEYALAKESFCDSLVVKYRNFVEKGFGDFNIEH